MKQTVLIFLSILMLFSCLQSTIPAGIPKNALLVTEDEHHLIYLNQEALVDEVPIVSLWDYDRKQEKVKQLLLTHPHARRDWFTMERTEMVSKDSIATISKVTILSFKDDPLTLLLEGCPDKRNVESFIYNDGRDSVLCLPTNGGLLGIADEEYTLVMQSYDYYEQGGRFSVISAFDFNGNLLNMMDVKKQQIN